MLTLAVLSGPWPRIGVVLAALLAAATMLARGDVRRAWTMLGAMVLALVLLLDDVWNSTQFQVVHRHPLYAAVAALLGVVLLAAAARLINRRPSLVPLLIVAALPFRLPISVGGATSNLLVPLYLVLAASGLAWIVPTLREHHLAGAPGGVPAAPREVAAQRPPRHRFEWLIAVYIVLYALQALYSTDFAKAVQNEIFFYVPFAVVLTLLRDVRWTRDLLVRSVVVTGVLAVIVALIGFGEEITRTLWLNTNLINSNDLHSYFQVNSVFFDPNIFGRYLALVMVLLVTILLYDRRTRIQVLSIVTLAVLWGCLIFTLSRSSLAGLAVGMAVLAALRWRARPVLYLGAVVVLVGAAVVVSDPARFGLNNLNLASSGRANLITGGIKLFGDRPLQGWGSAAFSVEYKHFWPRQASLVSDSHNIPITVASEQGVIGLIVYGALVIGAIVTLLRGARGDPFRVGIAATFLALLLHTMLYADFLEDPTTWTLLGIGGALATAPVTGLTGGLTGGRAAEPVEV